MSTPADLIQARRAARILGVHPSTVGRYRRLGMLRAWRVAGEQWRYSEAEVLALLEPAGEDQAPPPPTRAERAREEEAALSQLRQAGWEV